MGDLLSDVLLNLKCIATTKQEGHLTLRQLNSDYKTTIGEWIPYQKLGFKRLEDLILSAPNVFNVSQNGSEWYVSPRISEKSAHIAEMVHKQKAPKRRPPPKVRFSRNYQQYQPPRLQKTEKWRPKSNIPNKYQGSKRPQAVNHSQFVDRGPTVTFKGSQPSVASKVVIPENSSYNSRPQQRGGAAPAPTPAPAPAPAPAPIKRVTMNNRLTTNRVTENMLALSNIENVNPLTLNGTSKSNTVNASLNNVPQPQSVQQSNNVKKKTLDPLVSTKKRIMRKVTELSLERDSGNSSPTNDIPPPSPDIPPPSPDIPLPSPSPSPSPPCKLPEFVRTDDPLADLKTFAEIHKLGEVKVNVRLMVVGRKRSYTCIIKIGSKYSFGSYPNDCATPKQAQDCSCENALKDLIPMFERKSLMIASERDILERIPPMLEKHPHGIWAWQLCLDYSDKFNEILTDDWLKTIDVSPCVQIEKVSDDYILRHCQPGSALQKGQLRNSVVPMISHVSVAANTVRFGDDGKLTAQVTCAMSASEIWCQQTGTEESEKYGHMMDRLQIYYQDHEHLVKTQTILPAGYYIAKIEGGYYRVRAVKVADEEVECFFIDWGDELAVPKADIFELKREYATAQAQAFVCRLYGLEELYEVSINSHSLTSLYEKPVIIEMALDVATNEDMNDALPVFMYDLDTGESINQDLIPKLTMEIALPTLIPDGITEVYVSNIESNGDVYVQVRTQGYENFAKMKAQLEQRMKDSPPEDTLVRVTRGNSREKLYFYKQVDGSWHRIKLIDWSPQGDHAQIYFVDDGHAEVIRVAETKLYPLEAIDDIFNNYPYQAVKVRMSVDKIPDNFVALAKKHMPQGQPVLLKILGKIEKENLPLVNLFRRNPDGGLFCINTSIPLETEIKKEENNNLRGKFRLTGSECVPSTGALKCPTLPKIGENEYFEVYIPVAVSPYNFFIQPLESKQKLNDMMERLQERYSDVQYGNLKVNDVLPGSIYASKHDDGNWYRTSVIKVIHSGSVSVFYCDFGYYQTVPVKYLVPLDDEFMELPYQALKAKLSGVKPTKSKWTMNDCEQFKSMIEKKQFFALLVNIEKDVLYESDLVLKVYLIDTSSEEDVYIGKELVNKGMAVEE